MSTPSSAGWYDDPDDSAVLRYFDGVVWTSHRTPKAAPPREQPHAPGVPQQGSGPGGQPPVYPAGGGGQPPAYGQASRSGQSGQGQAPEAPQAPGQQWQQPGQAPATYPQQGGWNQPGSVGGRPVTADGVPLAGYWQRVGAFVLDWIIQSLIGLVLGGYFLFQGMQGYFDQIDVFMSDVEAGRNPDVVALLDSIDAGQLTIYTVIGIAVFALYQYLFLVRSGQTPGKMVAGISVREKNRAGAPSGPVVLRRIALPTGFFALQFVPFLSWLGSIGRLVDLLFPAWDNGKQTLHDKVADTVVVVGKQPKAEQPPQQQSPHQQF